MAIYDPEADEAAGRLALVAPTGAEIRGTLESTPGCALASAFLGEDGQPQWFHEGGTDIDWNGQETLTIGGETLFIDSDGAAWRASQLVKPGGDERHEEPWSGETSPTELLAILADLIDWHAALNDGSDAPCWKAARRAIGLPAMSEEAQP